MGHMASRGTLQATRGLVNGADSAGAWLGKSVAAVWLAALASGAGYPPEAGGISPAMAAGLLGALVGALSVLAAGRVRVRPRWACG